jgi:hypothetical protein
MKMSTNINLDPTSSSTEQVVNTTFADQQLLNTALGQQSSLPPQVQYIPDMSWRAAQQLQKPVIVGVTQWSTVDPIETTLLEIVLPDYYTTSAETLHTETLKMYSQFRGNPVFRFQVNGTKFHLGQLIASWQPMSTWKRASESLYTTTGFPHVQLSASDNEPVELRLPFVHPQAYLSTNALNSVYLGTLKIQVLNQLRAAAASSNAIHLTVTLHWEDAEVKVPIYKHPITGTENSIAEATGLFGDIAETATSATAVVSHLTTGNFAGVIKGAASMISPITSLLSGVGLLDKPNYITTPQKTISPISALSHGKGTDTSIRMGLDPGAMPEKSIVDFGDTADEMTVSHIVSTPMMFSTLNWPVTLNSGDRLCYFPVSPLLASNSGGVITLPFLAYLANMFQYWRGSIKYRLDFISTSFHTGRLLVAYIPNNFDTSSPSITQAMSCPYTIIDLQKSSRVSIEVPFISPTPYKLLETSNTALDNSGFIYIYVLNELVMPDNVANNIDINLYISGGNDFEFSVPCDCLIQFDEPAEATGLFKTVQGGNYVEEEPIILGTQETHSYPPHFGEQFPLSDLIKRYTKIQSLPSLTTNEFKNAPATTGRGSPSRQYAGPLAALAQLFSCWTGSLRYKLLSFSSRTQPANLTVTTMPCVYDIGSPTMIGTGYPVLATNTAQDTALEFELPPYTPFNFALLDPFGFSPTVNMGTFIVNSDVPSIPCDLYQAAGDDFRAFYMVAPPTCYGAKVNYLTP